MHGDLTSSEEPELATDCEILWCKIKLRGCRSLLVGCFYHPHTHNTDSMKAFVDSAHRAATTRNATVILGGDFNLPGWHWPTKTLKAGAPYPIVHRAFMDTVNDLGWEQVVPVPTRGENFLDLFLTDHPTLVQRTENLPGLADHDAVYMEFQIHPPNKRQPQCQIPLYNDQCIETLKQAATKLDQHIMATFNEDSSVEAIWTELRQGLKEAVAQHVPHKTAKSKRSLSWIDQDTRKLIKRRDCIHKRWKKSGNEEFKREFKHLKRQVQKRLRRSYWRHVESLITENDTTPLSSKKFWGFIKSRGSEGQGEAPPKRWWSTGHRPERKSSTPK